MTNSKKWYAVYTRPRWEKKVDKLLQSKGLQSYCPLSRVSRQWSDRKKVVQEPLFVSYVFVHVSEEDILSVKQTEGVINLLYWLGRPAIIRDEEIETIRQFLDIYENVNLERIKVNVNTTVKIIEGPFMDMEGKVVEVMHNTVKVLLPSLGYALIAPVTKVAVLRDNAMIEKTA